MRADSATMEQFMTEVRQDLQDRLSQVYPDARVEMQDVDKVQGESYRGLMIRQDGHRASPVFNLQPMYDQLSFRTYENVLEDLVRKAVDIIENPLTMDGGKCILQLRGVRPFLSRKYDLTKHPNYGLTADADDKNVFNTEKYLKRKLKLRENEEYTVIEE